MKQTSKSASLPAKSNTIADLFIALSFEEKVKIFKGLKDNLEQSFQEQHKKQEERACFLKENYQMLIQR